ncbi:uncharacterized protein EI90DRAFT_3075040 [Cantharellus anzutake]|uniref:uncharacterized protein n=1 Tax=Cantharellus anzutake TaxID=1750568 RepID=UPI00190471DE|nr:uncharacterized protein EI90DRAFT_3075040 [Cantharellus anzutake]KAF8324551.1 hypothetical protein EI90DRAFT_3075040 [Cantharellus anzutake]
MEAMMDLLHLRSAPRICGGLFGIGVAPIPIVSINHAHPIASGCCTDCGHSGNKTCTSSGLWYTLCPARHRAVSFNIPLLDGLVSDVQKLKHNHYPGCSEPRVRWRARAARATSHISPHFECQPGRYRKSFDASTPLHPVGTIAFGLRLAPLNLCQCEFRWVLHSPHTYACSLSFPTNHNPRSMINDCV